MNTLLQQLYNGEIYPAERYRPLIEQYREMQKKQHCHYDDFVKELQQLQPPLHEKFIKIMDEQLDSIPLELSDKFIDGFRLGARMMIEILGDN